MTPTDHYRKLAEDAKAIAERDLDNNVVYLAELVPDLAAALIRALDALDLAIEQRDHVAIAEYSVNEQDIARFNAELERILEGRGDGEG